MNDRATQAQAVERLNQEMRQRAIQSERVKTIATTALGVMCLLFGIGFGIGIARKVPAGQDSVVAGTIMWVTAIGYLLLTYLLKIRASQDAKWFAEQRQTILNSLTEEERTIFQAQCQDHVDRKS